MKTRVRILVATLICLTAVTAWSGQTQHGAPGEVLEGITAEDQPVIRYGASTGSGDPMVLRLYEYSTLYNVDVMHDPARDLLMLDGYEIPVFTQFIQQATTHPIYFGLDHPAPSHQVVSNSLDGVIDTCSLVCLGCHDGVNAAETRIKTVGEWEVLFDSGNLSHPLGIDYDRALSRNSGLKPAAFLPPEIILPEGKVGCESCHNLYSTMPYFLVLSNLDSALCLGCHAK